MRGSQPWRDLVTTWWYWDRRVLMAAVRCLVAAMRKYQPTLEYIVFLLLFAGAVFALIGCN